MCILKYTQFIIWLFDLYFINYKNKYIPNLALTHSKVIRSASKRDLKLINNELQRKNYRNKRRFWQSKLENNH